jgi:predicted PurR-regulated permease PerM
MRSASRNPIKDSAVPRVVSFIVLLAILLLVGAYFFQVMAHFVVPLFLASVLVVVFKPLHARVVQQIPFYPRVSALVTTLLILLVVLLPTVWLGWKAALEMRVVYSYLTADVAEGRVDEEAQRAATAAAADDDDANGESTTDEAPPSDVPPVKPEILEQIVERTPKPVKEFYKTATGVDLSETIIAGWLKNALGIIGKYVVSGVQLVGKLLFGLIVMVLALYYFLADGPRMLASLMKLSPLDDEYERELLDKFANVSRAVVVASLASAVAQGVLAGIGYYFALNEGAPIFLLMMLSMVLAIVPFLGAAAIWVPTAIWIYLYQPVLENGQPVLDAAGKAVEGDAFTAIGLAIYGTLVVSAIDNVIKPLILHGQSNLHPLVALISILGGVQTLGPIGILVGPMLVAFVQALLNMVNKELLRFGDGTLEAKHGARATPLPGEPVSDDDGTELVETTAAALIARSEEAASNPKPAAAAPRPPAPKPPAKNRRRRK